MNPLSQGPAPVFLLFAALVVDAALAGVPGLLDLLRRPTDGVRALTVWFDRRLNRERRGEATRLVRIDGSPEWALPLLAVAHARGLAIESIDARGPSDLIVRVRDVPAKLRMGRDLERALRNWNEISERAIGYTRSAGEIELRFEGGAVLREIKKGREENDASR